MSFGFDIFIPSETAQYVINLELSFLLNKTDAKKQILLLSSAVLEKMKTYWEIPHVRTTNGGKNDMFYITFSLCSIHLKMAIYSEKH